MATQKLLGQPQSATEAVPKSYVDKFADWSVADYGALAWTNDPDKGATVQLLTGREYYTRFKMGVDGTIANANLFVTTAGTTQTHAYVGIYTLAGVLIGQGDGTTALQTAGRATIAITVVGGQSLTRLAGEDLYVGVIAIGTGTQPSITSTFATSAGGGNMMLTSTTYRNAINSGTISALQSPIGTMIAQANTPCVVFS